MLLIAGIAREIQIIRSTQNSRSAPPSAPWIAPLPDHAAKRLCRRQKNVGRRQKPQHPKRTAQNIRIRRENPQQVLPAKKQKNGKRPDHAHAQENADPCAFFTRSRFLAPMF